MRNSQKGPKAPFLVTKDCRKFLRVSFDLKGGIDQKAFSMTECHGMETFTDTAPKAVLLDFFEYSVTHLNYKSFIQRVLQKIFGTIVAPPLVS